MDGDYVSQLAQYNKLLHSSNYKLIGEMLNKLSNIRNKHCI